MRFSVILIAALLAGCGNGDSSTDGAPPDMLAPHDLLPPEDQAPPVCDVFTQVGCSAGEHCTVGKINGKSQNLCWPNTSTPIAEGGLCMPVSPDSVTVGDQCASGFACVSEIGDLRCRKLCLQHSDCKPNQACVAPTGSNQFGTVLGVDGVAVAACVDDSGCDPILQTGCPSGQRCLISRSDFEGRVAVCGVNVIGQGAPGADCASSLDCAAGVRCSGLGFCRQLCYAMQPASLPAGQGGCPANYMCSTIAGTNGTYGECD
jgi:hypothetical protein